MKKLVAVCLGVVLASAVWAAPVGVASGSEFALAEQLGDPGARSFFAFNTSAGNYIVRHDGFGEFTSPKGLRRAFRLGVPGRTRIASLYFLEHESDVFVLYEVREQGAQLVRMEQTKRKLRWSASLDTNNVEAPVIDGDVVLVREGERRIQISKTNGSVL